MIQVPGRMRRKERKKKIWKRQEKKEDVEREISKLIIDAT